VWSAISWRFWPEDQPLSGRRHGGYARVKLGAQGALAGDRTDEFVGAPMAAT